MFVILIILLNIPNNPSNQIKHAFADLRLTWQQNGASKVHVQLKKKPFNKLL